MNEKVLDIPAVVASEVSNKIEQNSFSANVYDNYCIYRIFYNSLNVRVRVIDRMGVSTIIPPSYVKGEKGKFFISDVRAIPREVKFDSTYLLNSTAEEYAERKVMAQEKEIEFDPMRYHKNAQVIYTFTMRQIMAHGGTFYHPESDMVIAVIDETGNGLTENRHIVHPFSHEGRIEQSKRNLTKDLEARRFNDFIYTIRIVDNLGSYGKRFTMINGQVYSITPIRDTMTREGIYISRSYAVDGDFDSTGVEDFYLELGEKTDNELGLFRTYHEAKITKDRLVAMELELKELKITEAKQTAKFKEQEAKLNAEIDELKFLRDKRKEMNAYNNEVYKTQSDFLKHLPTIITALGTIIVVSLKVAESMGGGGNTKK